MEHLPEALGCIHHIAVEGNLAEGSRRHSWIRNTISINVSSFDAFLDVHSESAVCVQSSYPNTAAVKE